MAGDFESYTHLNYEKGHPDKVDDFVEFLYQNSDMEAPDVDENLAWERFNTQLNAKSSNFNFGWMKVAASVAIVFTVTLLLFWNNQQPENLLVASTDYKINVTFPDGSIGVLNTNSSFTYPAVFSDERNVSFKGEAYFDIKKSTKPFIIDANGVEVKVLGTAFNLISTDESVALYVDRGLVAFSKDGEDTQVKAGLEAIFNKKTNEVTIKEIPSTNIMSWRDGLFKFDNTPLSEALKDLEEYYKVDFKLTNEQLTTCKITVTIENKSLSEVLNIIEQILDVKTELKNKSVKISGKGC